MSDLPVDSYLTPPTDFSIEDSLNLIGEAGATPGRFKGDELFAKNLRDYYIHLFFANGDRSKNFYIESTASFQEFLADSRISLVVDPTDGATCYGFPNGSTLLIAKTLNGIVVDKPIINVPNPTDPTAFNGFALIGRDFSPSRAVLLALHDGPTAINNAFIRLKDINKGFAPVLYLESVVLGSTRLGSIAQNLTLETPPTQWGYGYPSNPNTPPVNVLSGSIGLKCENADYPAYGAPHPASLCFIWESIVQGFDKGFVISGFDFIYTEKSAMYFCNNGWEIENSPKVDILSLIYQQGLSNGSVIKTGTNVKQLQTSNVITVLNPYESVYNITNSANLKLAKISGAFLTSSSGTPADDALLENQHFNSAGLNQKDTRIIVKDCLPAPSSEIVLIGTFSTTSGVAFNHVANAFMPITNTITPLESERFEQVGTGANTRYYYRGLNPTLVSTDLLVFMTNNGTATDYKCAIGLNTLDKNHTNANLAGTISYSNGGTTVTGVGTSFLSDFDKKNEIEDTTNNVKRIVKSVTSNTSLEVETPFTSSGSGASYRSGVYNFLNSLSSLIRIANAGSSQLLCKYAFRMSKDDYLKIYTNSTSALSLTITSVQFLNSGKI